MKQPKTLVESYEVEGLTAWDFACDCGFMSRGWPTEKLAKARKAQHLEEHATGKPAPPKADLLTNSDEARDATNLAMALSRARGA